MTDDNKQFTPDLDALNRELTPSPAPKQEYIPSKYRSTSGDTMEAIQTDMRRTATDLEKALDGYRKRFEYLFDNLKSTIDELKRLAG